MDGINVYVFIETSCVQRGAIEWKTKPFQTVLSNHNIFTALSVCLAQTDAISQRAGCVYLSLFLCNYFYWHNHSIFFLFFRRPASRRFWYSGKKILLEAIQSRDLAVQVFPNSDDANFIPVSFEWQPQNLIVHICLSLFPSLSHSLSMMPCVCMCVCVQSTISSRHTHTHTITRYGSQFVSSPSSALLSEPSKECRVLFIQTIQSCFKFFFPILFFFFRPVVRIKRTCEDPTFHTNVHKENVVELDATTRPRQYWFFENFFFSIILTTIRLIDRMFFFSMKTFETYSLGCVYFYPRHQSRSCVLVVCLQTLYRRDTLNEEKTANVCLSTDWTTLLFLFSYWSNNRNNRKRFLNKNCLF